MEWKRVAPDSVVDFAGGSAVSLAPMLCRLSIRQHRQRKHDRKEGGCTKRFSRMG